jgi:sigma-B regulation protein RsbU (phosphoserine phosphatase)
MEVRRQWSRRGPPLAMEEKIIDHPSFEDLFPREWYDNELLSSILDSIPDIIYIKDCGGRFIVSNRAQRESHGIDTEEGLRGKTVFDLYPSDLAERFDNYDRHVMDTGEILRLTERTGRRPDGSATWTYIIKIPLRTADGRMYGILGISRDVTERKQQEEELEQQQNLLNALMDTIPDHIYFKDRQSRMLRVNQAMADWFGLSDPGEAVGKSDFDLFSYEHAHEAFEDEQRIIQSGKPILDKEEKETWRDGHITWVSTSKMPLRDREGRILGTFGVSRDISERKQIQLRMAQYATELREMNARLEADLNMAQELQRAFLPSRYPSFPPHADPDESQLQFAHYYQPVGKVGGDFFSVLQLSDTKAGVFFCDVMGHGVRSALITAMIRTLIAELAGQALHPGPFLSAVNKRLRTMLQLDWETLFATACYLVLDLEAAELCIANAGHPSPYLIEHRTGEVRLLTDHPDLLGPAIGLRESHSYQSRTVAIQPQDMVLLYTDGLYDIETKSGELFDEMELIQTVRRIGELPPESLFDALLNAIRQQTGQSTFEDDVCLFAIDIRGIGSQPPRTPLHP